MDWKDSRHRVGWLAADAEAAAGSAVGSAASTAGSLNLVSAGIAAFTGIATTVAAISDQKKQTEIMRSLSVLDNQQKDMLNKQLLAAGSVTQRLTILSNAIVQFAIANQQSTNRNKIILYSVAGVLVIGLMTLVIIRSKRKA